MTDKSCIVSVLFFFDEGEAVYVDNPALSTVLAALRTLDGNELDTFFIQLKNGDMLEVGGGDDDRYKCHATTSDNYFDLVKPSSPRDPSDTVMINMCQEGWHYPRCLIVSLEVVIEAIKYFATSGKLNPKLKWDNTLEYEPTL